MALQTSFLPVSLVPGLINLEFEEDSLFKTIKKHFNHDISNASELLKTSKCDAYEAKILKVSEGDAVFLLANQITPNPTATLITPTINQIICPSGLKVAQMNSIPKKITIEAKIYAMIFPADIRSSV